MIGRDQMQGLALRSRRFGVYGCASLVAKQTESTRKIESIAQAAHRSDNGGQISTDTQNE